MGTMPEVTEGGEEVWTSKKKKTSYINFQARGRGRRIKILNILNYQNKSICSFLEKDFADIVYTYMTCN